MHPYLTDPNHVATIAGTDKCLLPSVPLTVPRNDLEHVVEGAGNESAQLGRLVLALHGVRLARARLPVRKNGACGVAKDAPDGQEELVSAALA